MKRVNGFLILDQFNSKDESNHQRSQWINLDDKIYYLKRSNFAYGELIAEEFYKLLGFNSAHYDLAMVDTDECVISEDYRENKCIYIPGYKIVKKFINKVDQARFIYFANNIEYIWQALAFRYKNKPNREEIVYNLVNELKKRYIVKSLFLLDSDYHLNNWEIKESNKSVEIAPIFDSEAILQLNVSSLSFTIDGQYQHSISDEIKEYLNISSEEDVQDFESILLQATPELFNTAITNVEKRIDANIPEKIKDEYSLKYQQNYYMIKDIFLENRGKHGR